MGGAIKGSGPQVLRSASAIALSSFVEDECVRRVSGNAGVGLLPQLQEKDRIKEKNH